MNLKQATDILEAHQIWRKGGETEPTDPTQLGIAIDVILKELKKLKNNP